MNLLGTKRIVTERLILRKLVASDAEDMFKNWAGLDETFKYLPWRPTKSVEVIQERLNNWIDFYGDNTYYQWGIESKTTKELIGVINLHDVDIKGASAETSFILAKKVWNNGFMTEALGAVLRFGFVDVGLNRVYADYFDGNTSSKKVLEKNKFQYESTIKEEYLKDAIYYYSIQYSITKKEWEE